MRSLFKDPLLHFLLLGAGLFALYAWRAAPPERASARIEISAEEMESLRQAVEILQGRNPTAAELEELVEPTIREEILYREALALGLDRDDVEVRRRLVEKMAFLSQDLVDPAPPADEELEAFVRARPELFHVPTRITFEQLFFSPAQRGDRAQADAEAALERLRAGQGNAVLTDPVLLESRYAEAEHAEIAPLFGQSFADAVFAMQPTGWRGPIRSQYGLHLVRLSERTEAYEPGLEEVREQALELYRRQRLREANEAAYRELRRRYDIVIRMPESVNREAEPE